MITGSWEHGKIGRGVQTVQTSGCKMNKLWKCSVQYSNYSQQYCIVYLKVTKKVDHTHTKVTLPGDGYIN